MRLKDLWRDTCGDVKVLNVRDGAEYFSSKDDAGAISKKEDLSKAEKLVEKLNQFPETAQEMFNTYVDGVMAGLRLRGKDETVSQDESKDA